MTKKKDEKRRRLRSLILLLFLTIVLLSTSTYAWFTANKTVNIDPINVNVAASSGIQISADASTWKTLLTNTDITTGYTNDINMMPTELAPVSTDGTVTTTGANQGLMVFYDGLVDGATGSLALTTSLSDAEAHGTSSRFIAFDIFLKVDDVGGAPIYLTNGSGVVSTANQTDKGLQNAARYAFVNEGYVSSTAAPSDAQALKGGTSSIVVEPNFDAHTSTGVNNAGTYYGYTTGASGEVREATSGAPAVNYVGVKGAISTAITLINTNVKGSYDTSKFGTITNLYKTNVAYSQNTSSRLAYKGNTQETALLNVFTLPQGISKIRVYMWVEGQDVDCENYASGAYLTYTLGFTLLNE